MFPTLVPMWNRTSKIKSLRQRAEWRAYREIPCVFGVSALLEARACGIVLEMSSTFSCSVPWANQANMEEIAQNIHFLPEKILREIAKGPLVKFTLSCEDPE